MDENEFFTLALTMKEPSSDCVGWQQNQPTLAFEPKVLK